MLKGHVDTASHVMIDGWAADDARPDVAVNVDILLNNRHLVTVTADNLREDLAALGEFGAGHHGFRFTFAAPLSAATTHRISVRYADNGTLLPAGERVLRAPGEGATGSGSALTPILVNVTARSGTTLLMAVLAHAPEIIVAELVPFETRLLSYYANAHNVLTHGADMVRSTHSDDLEGDGFHIGFNPYNGPDRDSAFLVPAIARDYTEHYVPSRLDESFHDVITEYYCRLARDRGKPKARFFAEKNNNWQNLVRSFTRRAFGAVREIVTIRDPRDVLCSQMSFFKIEAERSFSELNSALEHILDMHAEGSRDIYFNVYEQLLRGDKACFVGLSEFLQTEIVQLKDEARRDVFAKHGTSANADATVERWRTDLNQEWQDRCLQAWRPFLEKFGYALR
jgi:hypothetical protein